MANKIRIPLALLVLAAMSLSAFTHQAKAMTVSDPTSYTYYAEQVKQATAQIEKLEAQLDEAKNMVTGIEEVKEQLTGVYGTMDDLTAELEKYQEEIESAPNAILEYANTEKLLDAAGKEIKIDNAQQVPEAVLDSVYVDVRDVNGYGYENENERHQLEQKSLRDVIVESGKTVISLQDRLDWLQQVMDKINDESTNPNEKSAIDWNSRLLAEIVRVLHDMMALQARHFVAQNMLKYEGVDDEAHEKAKLDIKTTTSPEARSKKYWDSIEDKMDSQYK